MIDVAKIDRQLAFLHEEIGRLRRMAPHWAQVKAEKLEGVVETLIEVRREKQMTGLGGKQIW